MSEKSRAKLKEYFQAGQIPTEDQFADLIDSTLNKGDDGIFTSQPNDHAKIGIGINSPEAPLSVNTFQNQVVQFLKDSNKKWNIVVDDDNNLIISNAEDEKSFFLVKPDGSIGIGSSNPTAPLSIQSKTEDVLSIDDSDGKPKWKVKLKDKQLDIQDMNNTSVVNLSQDGQVGIGTDTSKVNATVSIKHQEDKNILNIQDSADNDRWVLGMKADGELNLQSENNDILNIEQGGKIYVGSDSTSAHFHVQGNLQLQHGIPVNQIADATTTKDYRPDTFLTENAIKKYIDDMFVGSISAFSYCKDEDGKYIEFKQKGWLICDGEHHPQKDFPRLFKKIGFIYGRKQKGDYENDAVDDFRVPNLIKYFIRGCDNEDTKFGKPQEDQFRKHIHKEVTNHIHKFLDGYFVENTDGGLPHPHPKEGDRGPGNSYTLDYDNRLWVRIANTNPPETPVETGPPIINDTSEHPNIGEETLPKHIPMLYCIKY